MKTLFSLFSLFLFLLLFTTSAYAQQDSALLVFQPVKDKDTRMLYDLLNVQQCNISCQDTALHGKSFYLTLDEYKDGKLVMHDDLGLKTKSDTVAVVTGTGEKFYHIIDFARLVNFHSDYDAYSIDMMGKLENDSLLLKIYFPGLHITRNLACKENYQFRRINPCGSSDSMYIRLNTPEPYIAFTPPVKVGYAGDYCALGLKDFKDWFKEYKIEHYYVFSLLIK